MTTLGTCPRCNAPTSHAHWAGARICTLCEPLMPDSLLKACTDQFDYALQVRTGLIFRFTDATIHGEWVTLTGLDWNQDMPGPYPFERGVDIRLSDIVWCADAPQGS